MHKERGHRAIRHRIYSKGSKGVDFIRCVDAVQGRAFYFYQV
jgi:hypothetical protein